MEDMCVCCIAVPLPTFGLWGDRVFLSSLDVCYIPICERVWVQITHQFTGHCLVSSQLVRKSVFCLLPCNDLASLMLGFVFPWANVLPKQVAPDSILHGHLCCICAASVLFHATDTWDCFEKIQTSQSVLGFFFAFTRMMLGSARPSFSTDNKQREETGLTIQDYTLCDNNWKLSWQ